MLWFFWSLTKCCCCKVHISQLFWFAHFLDSFFCSFVLWVFCCFSCSSWLCKCFGWCCCLLLCYSSSSWFLKQGLTSLVPFFHLSLLRDCLKKKWEFSSFCLQKIASCLAWCRLLLDPLRKKIKKKLKLCISGAVWASCYILRIPIKLCISVCGVVLKTFVGLKKIPSSSSGASLCGVFLSFLLDFQKHQV